MSNSPMTIFKSGRDELIDAASIAATEQDIRAFVRTASLASLMAVAARLRDEGHGNIVTYSRKVFIPLTKLCRDTCGYCTFAQTPRKLARAYLTRDEVLQIARDGASVGCKEALFTLGDKPELRYAAARSELEALGFATTIDYLAEMCRVVYEETGLLPHVNPGVLTADDIAQLRRVSISQGMMLESTSLRLAEAGHAHYGSPDKVPAVRLATIEEAGRQKVPFTSGILIGIGETRDERLDALFALRDSHARHGHLQEIIVQNFRAKPGTKMAKALEPSLEEHLWTIAAARLIFGPAANIQAPPNLSPGHTAELLAAGINDFGGISPVTPDHVNPEAPWPLIDELAREVAGSGKELFERLATYPAYLAAVEAWTDARFQIALRERTDTTGFPRYDDWAAGAQGPVPASDAALIRQHPPMTASPAIRRILDRISDGERLDEDEIVDLFAARGTDFSAVCKAADRLRQLANGDVVSYAVNRNINYTNVCYFNCKFCAFSKGSKAEHLRGKSYDLDLEEIQRRVIEAWDRGATEVCLQGGIHPDYTGATYLAICRGIKAVVPAMHIHAFSPLEVWQGAKTLRLPLREFLTMLKEAGLSSLPGTAAEILHDEVRAVLCPDKINTAQWLEVIETAHEVGLRTTATIMFGHIDHPRHWASHLLAIRDIQSRTGGFTEFVPLPFVSMEAPMYLRSTCRPGPTFREAVLMHAVARLVLFPLIDNIQASWVKLGLEGAKLCFDAGCNDIGGSLMDESITRAAGASHGRELAPAKIRQTILAMGREPVHRTTLYTAAPAERTARAENAPPLATLINAPAGRRARIQGSSRLADPKAAPTVGSP